MPRLAAATLGWGRIPDVNDRPLTPANVKASSPMSAGTTSRSGASPRSNTNPTMVPRTTAARTTGTCQRVTHTSLVETSDFLLTFESGRGFIVRA